jgi:Flp pilus assembly protein TadD
MSLLYRALKKASTEEERTGEAPPHLLASKVAAKRQRAGGGSRFVVLAGLLVVTAVGVGGFLYWPDIENLIAPRGIAVPAVQPTSVPEPAAPAPLVVVAEPEPEPEAVMAEPAVAVVQPEVVEAAPPVVEPQQIEETVVVVVEVAVVEAAPEPEPEPDAASETVVEAVVEPGVEPAPEPETVVAAPEPVVAAPEPVVEVAPESEPEPAPVVVAPESVVEVAPEPEPEPVAEVDVAIVETEVEAPTPPEAEEPAVTVEPVAAPEADMAIAASDEPAEPMPDPEPMTIEESMIMDETVTIDESMTIDEPMTIDKVVTHQVGSEAPPPPNDDIRIERVPDTANPALAGLITVIDESNYFRDRYGAAKRSLNAGAVRSALAIYDELLARQPTDRVALLGRATALHRLDQTGDAILAYEKVLQRFPDELAALTNMLGLIGQQSPGKALSQLGRIYQINPSLAPVAAQMAMIHARLGDNANALRFMTEAAAIEPRNASFQINLAIMNDHAGNRDAAIRAYEQALAAAAGSSQALPLTAEAIRERLKYLRAN